MAGGISEDELVEQPAMRLLGELGWQTASAFDEKPGPADPIGRDSFRQVVLVHRLRSTITHLNPGLPDTAVDAAIAAVTENRRAMDPVRANREIHTLLRNGVKVRADLGRGRGVEPVTVRLVNWDNTAENDWLAVSQLWVHGELYRRRADIVLFVNGIPLVFIELKVSHRDVREAFDGNLRDYRDVIPALFWHNAFVILSNGADTKVGSTYAPWEHFSEWTKIDSEGEVGVVSLETALRGTCRPDRLLDIVENFVTYLEMPGGLIKAVAKYHQYLGVNAALDGLHAARAEGSSRLGVFWHTQGSGKTLSNLWFTRKVLRKVPGNWTFVEVTDRVELDEQLYETFVNAGAVTDGAAVHAESSAHLRELLAGDHRYIFTLIHKFRPAEGDAEMPVLSMRDDIIVITDEAHRSQYDQLAWNMRTALPGASFLGFTGTPLIAGEEELTRQVFGEYVSTYNFRDSIADGATVPLYYENRTPELQLTNDDFDADLARLLDDAALDEAEEAAVQRQFARQYHLITRTARLERVADDLVDHFVGRGFRGKAMYVAIDKATAVRMHDLVAARWAERIAAAEARLTTLGEHERGPVADELAFLRSTEMAVVVSQAQNEVADLADLGLDITPHRRRMIDEPLDERFKDPADPFRLVFVCAMWLTGFDAPSCSTIYLDKPMRNHTLMQTIARANRVFPDKDTGLIVDYVGVFRNLEDALAIYGSARDGGDLPVRDTAELRADLDATLDALGSLVAERDVDLDDLVAAGGFEFIALQSAAVEALLGDDAVRRRFNQLARHARSVFKSLMPDTDAARHTRRVAVVGTLAARLTGVGEKPDISGVMDAVAELLDASVGAEEDLINADAATTLVDLNDFDFEALARRFAGRKRTAVKTLQDLLAKRLDAAVRRNPTRVTLAEKFRRLIDDYNAGTHNTDEIFRRLKSLNDELTDDEARGVREELTEEQLAIYDLLTKPEPELTKTQQTTVKNAARMLLDAITDKLVLDWRKNQNTRGAVESTIKDVLDAELPDVYDEALFEDKTRRIYEHLFASHFDDGTSIYDPPASAADAPAGASRDVGDVLEAVRADAEALARIREEVFGLNRLWLTPTAELLTVENRHVEFKQRARWSLDHRKEGQHERLAEEIIASTVAGFCNGEGGVLLIGVRDHPVEAVGLDPDYAHVRPHNADGFVNWLDTMLQNTLGHAGAHRVRVRVDQVDGVEVCRVDVPASSRPIWMRAKGADQVLYERRNNSTRAVPTSEVDAFIAERFG